MLSEVGRQLKSIKVQSAYRYIYWYSFQSSLTLTKCPLANVMRLNILLSYPTLFRFCSGKFLIGITDRGIRVSEVDFSSFKKRKRANIGVITATRMLPVIVVAVDINVSRF